MLEIQVSMPAALHLMTLEFVLIHTKAAKSTGLSAVSEKSVSLYFDNCFLLIIFTAAGFLISIIPPPNSGLQDEPGFLTQLATYVYMAHAE